MSFPGRPSRASRASRARHASRDRVTRKAVATQPAAAAGGAVKSTGPISGTAKSRVSEKCRQRRSRLQKLRHRQLRLQQWHQRHSPPQQGRQRQLRLQRWHQRLPIRRMWLKIRRQTGLAVRDLSLKRLSPKNLSFKNLSLKDLSLNRGDLLLLMAGVVAFFVLTFLPGVVSPGSMAGSSGARPAAVRQFSSLTPTGPRETTPPDAFPWNRGAAAAKIGKGSATAAPTPQAPQPHLPANFPPVAAPTRIVYPAAGLDVVVHPLNPSQDELDSQAIVPPITMDGYWVTNFGTPGIGSSNTTYILGHSWEDRDAPFNRLSAASAPGDIFEATTTAGTIRYRVDSVDTYAKTTLKDSPIWTAVPNRLVLISCYAEDLWGKNVVVVASPVLEP